MKKSFSFPGVWFVFLAGSDARILTCLAKPQKCCLHRDNILFPETHLKQGTPRAKRGCWGKGELVFLGVSPALVHDHLPMDIWAALLGLVSSKEGARGQEVGRSCVGAVKVWGEGKDLIRIHTHVWNPQHMDKQKRKINPINPVFVCEKELRTRKGKSTFI